MLRVFRADLHIHTCLSPCGSLEMLPGRIVAEAKRKRLDIVGICDHNTAENVTVVKRAGEGKELKVLGGMEITSREEVHLLALFDGEKDLFELQSLIYDSLPGINNEQVLGEQLVVNEENEVIGSNDRLLMGATRLPIRKIVEAVHSLGGLAIASHIDREGFGIIGQLGFIPKGLGLDGLGISPRLSPEKAGLRFPQVLTFPMVTFSDAHVLEDIGRKSTSFLMEEATVGEIKKALRGEEGRKVMIQPK